jgi:hypothetical protein
LKVDNEHVEAESARPLAGCSARVSTQIGEGLQAAQQNGGVAAEFAASTCKDNLVYAALLGERATDLRDLLPVVEVLDGLLEADGNEQTDDDSGEVDEEVLPSMEDSWGAWTSSMGRASE